MKTLKMNLNSFIVTQNEIRNKNVISYMIEHVKEYGLFDKETLKRFSNNASKDLIQITRFEDGKLYIHDGHHRVFSCAKAGREYLFNFEYQIKDWCYKDYEDINFARKWVTPFNPITEVRLADFFDFKKQALQMYKVDKFKAIDWIIENPHLYKVKRKIKSIFQME